MPFRRNRFRRRRHKRRRFRRGRMVRRRRVVLDPEQKQLDIGVTLAIQNPGFLQLLNGLAEGSTVNQRIGRRCVMTSVLVNYCLVLDVGNVAPICYRMSLVRDKFPQGVAPNPNQVYNGQGTIRAPLGFRVLNNANRFQILWTRSLRLDLALQSRQGSVFTRMRISTRFNGPTNAIEDIENNALYIYLSSDTTGASAAPPMTLNIRSRFVG